MKYWRLSRTLPGLRLLLCAAAILILLQIRVSITKHMNVSTAETIADRSSILVGRTSVISRRSLKLIVLENDAEHRDDKNKSNETPSKLRHDHQCRIPKLDINGTEVIKFFHDPPPLNCSKGKDENWFYVDSERRFRITESATKEHGNISCFISPIYRISDEKISIGTPSNIATYGLLEGSDFAEVNCTAADRETRRGLLLTVLPKTKRVEQLRAIRKPSDWSGLDVFFLGFDSLSQMSFRRKLPRTTRFLEEKLNAVILNGYNIVGDGTPQAFIPILTSQTEQELPLTRKRFENANYVDVYPFIWRNFSDSGYITLYAEDMARFGIFSYRLKGFNKQPTDHYIRPFIQRLEGAYKSPKCVGSEPMHKQWFRYAGEFMKRYDRKVPKFLLAFHGVLSHDDINLVQVADEDLAQYLQEMLASSALNNSLIIVMADHGHRFAQLRSTHQGQLEERLPFFAVALPKWFRQSERGRTAWLNLQNNKNRLATPFDIHSTLIDVLHWPSQKELLKEGNIHKRSISLFRRIPLARSCAQAGIEPHWCTCLEWKSAMNAEQRKISTALAEMVVKAINEHTESERSMCAELRLKEILDSKRLVPHAKLLEYSGANDTDGFMPKFDGKTKAAFAYYQMKFVTIPGNAIYEVTLKYDSYANTATVDMNSISHINKYGNSPHCIIEKNYFLAKYCVCYDMVSVESIKAT